MKKKTWNSPKIKAKMSLKDTLGGLRSAKSDSGNNMMS